MRPTICNWWKSWDNQLMQIIVLNIGGALSQLASQQEASQEDWFNLSNSTKVLAKSWYRLRLFAYFTFPKFKYCHEKGLNSTRGSLLLLSSVVFWERFRSMKLKMILQKLFQPIVDLHSSKSAKNVLVLTGNCL